MKNELLELWNRFLQERIDNTPNDNLPSGSLFNLKRFVGKSVSLWEFMIWLEEH